MTAETGPKVQLCESGREQNAAGSRAEVLFKMAEFQACLRADRKEQVGRTGAVGDACVHIVEEAGLPAARGGHLRWAFSSGWRTPAYSGEREGRSKGVSRGRVGG